MTWEVKKLGDVIIIERGGSPRPIKKYLTTSSDGINWIKISDATVSDKYIYKTQQKITQEGLAKTRLVKEGDFILSNSMSFGRPYIMKTTGAIHDGWLVLKQKDEKLFETEFLYYLLSSPYVFQQFNYLASGSTVRNLNIALVSSVKVPVPPLPIQKKIVKVLDSAFEKIAKAKENSETNLKNAKEVFESYLQKVFENKGDDWEENILENITNVEYGFTGKAKKEGEYRYVRITDMDKDGLLILNNKLYLKKSKEADKFIIKNHDLLMARTGATFAKVLFFEEFEKSVFASYLIRINFNINMNNKLYWYFSKSKFYWNQANKLASGSAQPHFNGSAVKKVKFSYPKSLSEQKAIVSKLDNLSKQTKQLESIYSQKLSSLKELKQSILQKAFKGELTEVKA